MQHKHTVPPQRRVYIDYVRANPGCSTRELADATGVASRHIGAELDTLMRWGYLTCTMQDRLRFWHATEQPLPIPPATCDEPRQIVVKSWRSSPAGHWLDFALCGRVAA